MNVKVIDRLGSWICDLALDVDYSVTETRCVIDDAYLSSNATVTSRSNIFPIKVNIFSWRILLDCLLTRENLSLKGLRI